MWSVQAECGSLQLRSEGLVASASLEGFRDGASSLAPEPRFQYEDIPELIGHPAPRSRMIQLFQSGIGLNLSLALQQRVTKRVPHDGLPPACDPALNRDPKPALATAGNSFPQMTPRERSDSKLTPDELLYAGTPLQAQPERPSFSFHRKLEVEERAAESFVDDPFREVLHHLRLGRKAESISIRQLSHLLFCTCQMLNQCLPTLPLSVVHS